MAYILKSNKTVNDPNNIFPTITEFGEATQLLGGYFNRAKTAGYDLSETEFNALKTLETGLVNLDVDKKLIDILPIIGNFNSAMLKYKNGSLNSVNNFALANYTGKAFSFAKPSGLKMPALGLGIPLNALNNGYTAFIVYKDEVGNSGNPYRGIFGATAVDDTSVDNNAIYLRLYESTGFSGKVIVGNFSDSASSAYNKQVVSLAVKIGSEAGSTSRKSWVNKTQILNMTGNITFGTSTIPNKELYLGGINPLTSGNVMYPFWGKIAFFALFDGDVPDGKVIDIQNLIDNFIVATGKTL